MLYIIYNVCTVNHFKQQITFLKKKGGTKKQLNATKYLNNYLYTNLLPYNRKTYQ